jgi:hypothetical protein
MRTHGMARFTPPLSRALALWSPTIPPVGINCAILHNRVGRATLTMSVEEGIANPTLGCFEV